MVLNVLVYCCQISIWMMMRCFFYVVDAVHKLHVELSFFYKPALVGLVAKSRKYWEMCLVSNFFPSSKTKTP